MTHKFSVVLFVIFAVYKGCVAYEPRSNYKSDTSRAQTSPPVLLLDRVPANSYRTTTTEPPTTPQQHIVYPQSNDESNKEVEAYERNNIQTKISHSIFDLSRSITESLLKSSNDKYHVISPVSVAGALHLAFLGAKGDTYNEINSVLQYNNEGSRDLHTNFGEILTSLVKNECSEPIRIVNWRRNASENYINKYMKNQSTKNTDQEHKIEVANGIFVNENSKLRQEYGDVISSTYKGVIKNVEFNSNPLEASRIINEWVNVTTHGKIKEIVPPVLPRDTKIILANALYFKADWQQTFIEGGTMKKKFFPHGRDGDYHIMRKLMANGGKFPHYYDEETDVDVLGFPYKQNCTTMYVMLPRKSSIDVVKEKQKLLTAEKIDRIIGLMTLKTAVILFPKMHLTSGYYLKNDLRELGIETLFNRNADLSLIVDASGNNNSRRRGGNHEGVKTRRYKRDVSYKVESESKKSPNPLTMKDFLLRKRIVKSSSKNKISRTRRDVNDPLEYLESLRRTPTPNPGLFADEVIHKVDLTINEKGTEGGAATAITLNRSGSNVVFRVDVPFIFLIRHDITKTALFYGVVFEPPVEE